MYKRKIFAEDKIYAVSKESKKITRLQCESQDTKDDLELLKKQEEFKSTYPGVVWCLDIIFISICYKKVI